MRIAWAAHISSTPEEQHDRIPRPALKQKHRQDEDPDIDGLDNQSAGSGARE